MSQNGIFATAQKTCLLALTIAAATQSLERLLAYPVGTAGQASSGTQAATDTASSSPAEVRRGEIRFSPDPQEATAVPQPFQLEARTFAFEESPLPSVSDNVRIASLTFPSPVHTPQEVNNTVHCEYYCPARPGKHPACIVLHILGGDFALSRTFCRALADRDVAALFLIMPYYGPRRDPSSSARMISSDPEETVRGMTQAVKDIRYATAWLAAQDEVDANQLGIMGISLGGITSALAATAEPRLRKICPMLAGGGIGTIAWDTKEQHFVAARQRWEAAGGTRESFLSLMGKVDPAAYGEHVRGKTILMLNARHDEVIPRAATDALWTAFGKPPIVWFDAGHYTSIWYIADAMRRVTDFFQPGGGAQKPQP